MTKREIAGLCCKVLALYMVVQTVIPVSYGLAAMLTPQIDWSMRLYMLSASLVAPTVLVVLAVVVWRQSGVVAAWMVGHDLQDEQGEPDAIRIDARLADVHAVAFSCIGVWLLVTSLPTAASWGVGLLLETVNLPTGIPGPAGPGAASSLLDVVLRLLLGTWLLFGGRGLVQLLHRLRRIGLQE